MSNEAWYMTSTCALCGETVTYLGQSANGQVALWIAEDNSTECYRNARHVVDLSHALSHMSVEG